MQYQPPHNLEVVSVLYHLDWRDLSKQFLLRFLLFYYISPKMTGCSIFCATFDPTQTSFAVYRYEFMDRPGAIAEKKALYERIVSGLLSTTKIEKTSIGTFQGRDQEGVGVISTACCAIIATLSCLTHIQPSEGSNGIETSEIKEIVDNIAGKLAPLIRRSKESNESHRDDDDANSSADSDNLGVFDVTQFLRGCLVMNDLCAPTPRGGNILISDDRSEAILSPLKSGSGNLGMGKNMSACLYVVCIYVLC